MGDPTFTNRADLEAWAVKKAARIKWNIQMAPDKSAALSALENGMAQIKRVTMAHIHLPATLSTGGEG